MFYAGIDVGSVATKVVLLGDSGAFYHMCPTGWSPQEAGRQSYLALLERTGIGENQVVRTVGTGYGRVSLAFVGKTVTEIACHARGASWLDPGSTMVIDIGGQDSKVIKISVRGRVQDFVMNDRCAAGTGRFLQVTAAALGIELHELGELARGRVPVTLNSMCTVFAESEVIGLLAAGREKGEIVAGLFQSIARRIAGMARRLDVPERITFTGGVAVNQVLREFLRSELGAEVAAPEHCQYAGAIGAALLARESGRE